MDVFSTYVSVLTTLLMNNVTKDEVVNEIYDILQKHRVTRCNTEQLWGKRIYDAVAGTLTEILDGIPLVEFPLVELVDNTSYAKYLKQHSRSLRKLRSKDERLAYISEKLFTGDQLDNLGLLLTFTLNLPDNRRRSFLSALFPAETKEQKRGW